MHTPQDRLAWEDAVYLAIETRLEVCRSDAQALVEPQEDVLEGCWIIGISSDATATLLIENSTATR